MDVMKYANPSDIRMEIVISYSCLYFCCVPLVLSSGCVLIISVCKYVSMSKDNTGMWHVTWHNFGSCVTRTGK